METLSICMIAGDFFPGQIGGQGIYAYKVCEGIAKLGHEVYAVVPPKPERLNYYKRNRGFKVAFAQGLGSEAKLSFSFQAYRKFQEEFSNISFDILHGNELFGFMFLFKKPSNVKKFISISHNSYLERFYSSITPKRILYPILMHLEKMTYFNSDSIIVGSEMEQDFVIRYGINPSKINVVYYGTDLEKFKPSIKTGQIRLKHGIDLNEHVILFVGRMVERKKPHIVVEAMKHIVEIKPKSHCIFVGSGKFQKEVEKRVTPKIKNRIHFVGSVLYDDLPKYYADSDVFVLPSIGEGGISLVVLEAAASGLPLILTKDASSWCPILQTGINGFIVKPSNPIELSKKILLALEQSEVMGRKSRLIVTKHFNWKECVNETVKVYKKTLDETSYQQKNV